MAKFNFKKSIICLLVFALFFAFVPNIALTFAEGESTNFNINELLTNETYKEQEITDRLPFETTFEGGRNEGWETALSATGCDYKSRDMTSEEVITMDIPHEEEDVEDEHIDTETKPSDIGAAEGNYSFLFVNAHKGVAAAQTEQSFTIPARSIYILTMKIKISNIYRLQYNNGVYVFLEETQEGIAEEDADDLLKFQISRIRTTIEKDSDGTEKSVYISYSFLIYGDERYDKQARLTISLGYYDKEAYEEIKDQEDEENFTNSNGEIGIAAIDDIRMFTLTSEQAATLKTKENVTTANFSEASTAYENSVKNGAFNRSTNQPYDITKVDLFTPTNWKQTTTENNPEALYGIVDTNQTVFSSKFPEMTNPGLTTYQHSENLEQQHNNVLMLYNKTNTLQSITSDNFTASKNNIYEFTFEFCTPALMDNFADENNSVSFYLYNGDELIYSKENIYSYSENQHDKNTPVWKRLSFIIETYSVSQSFTFQIVFGDEQSAREGVVYIDNVRLATRTQEQTFDNIYENTLELKTEEGEETKYLPVGKVSFEDVKNLKENDIVSYISYVQIAEEEAANSNNENQENYSYLWYVIPSVLLVVSLIAGILAYYIRYYKHKPNKKARRKLFTRKANTSKPVNNNADIEQQLKVLEKDYNDGKIPLNKYLKKREKLEQKILKEEEIK